MKFLLAAFFVFHLSTVAVASDAKPTFKGFLVEHQQSLEDVASRGEFWMLQHNRVDDPQVVDAFELCHKNLSASDAYCERYHVSEILVQRCGPDVYAGQAGGEEIVVSIFNARKEAACEGSDGVMTWKVELNFLEETKSFQGFPVNFGNDL